MLCRVLCCVWFHGCTIHTRQITVENSHQIQRNIDVVLRKAGGLHKRLIAAVKISSSSFVKDYCQVFII